MVKKSARLTRRTHSPALKAQPPSIDAMGSGSVQEKQQAASNSKERFSRSPDLSKALMDAIMDAFEAHQTMSSQALGSERVRDGLRDILLGPAQLNEALRARSGMSPTAG